MTPICPARNSFADPVELAASPSIDLFVELIGGAEGPARASVETALAHGKSVVTANKALLAAHGLHLAALAEENHAALAFEASVAGGIPIVKTLREGLAGNSIERVYGILNGTCNYILSRMEQEQLSFEECLEGGAKARLCRGRSDLRHRRFRHRAQACDPHLAGLRHAHRRRAPSISRALSASRLPTSTRPANLATASSCWASRSAPPTASSSASIRRWCSKTSAIAQVMGVAQRRHHRRRRRA